MTVREAIRQADELRPNTVSDEMKCRWLAQLDGILRRQVTARAAGQPDGKTTGADTDTQDDTTLLAEEPYSAVYLYWLMAQIDLALGELARYANDMTLYNSALAEYTAGYRAEHLPRAAGQFCL